MTEISNLIRCHQAIAEFLNAHRALLEKFSYDNVCSGQASIVVNTYYGDEIGLSIGGNYYGDDPQRKADMLDSKAALFLKVRRAIGGKWDKDYGHSFTCTKTSADPAVPTIKIIVEREAVCTKTVTGTKEVHVPARPAVEEHVRVEEVVEWDCGF